jgi:hypothetical protein
VIFVDMEWPTSGPLVRKAAVITIKVATNMERGESSTYLFHLASITKNFRQFYPLPLS